MSSSTALAAATAPRELATRESDGVQVTLLWDPGSGDVTLRVDDRQLAARFEARVPADRALHAFAHPFTHSRDDVSRGVAELLSRV
jgi:hypothetical protein